MVCYANFIHKSIFLFFYSIFYSIQDNFIEKRNLLYNISIYNKLINYYSIELS